MLSRCARFVDLYGVVFTESFLNIERLIDEFVAIHSEKHSNALLDKFTRFRGDFKTSVVLYPTITYLSVRFEPVTPTYKLTVQVRVKSSQ